MKLTLSLVALVAAAPALAEETRELDAHEHGVGALNIAMDGTTVAMEFHAPGADIVGFEYAAKSDDDLAAIEAAVSMLSAPLDLFTPSAAAGCSVTSAKAALESEDEHEDHDEHAHDEDKHEDHDEHAHDEDKHDDHDHDEHAHDEDKHDDHGDEDHAEHEEEAGHSEFHAEYMLTCDNPDALTEITFAYFDAFPNAQEVEVQLISASGAQAFEVEKDAPVLELKR